MAKVINIAEWIEANQSQFLPPVCNKMLHDEGQLKIFFVGGKNQRKDYHIECGEELFLQLKGKMVLKVVEQGKHRDITINEGEMFLLPCKIPHSPQRFDGTIGLVIERERAKDELDGLRYFIENDGKTTLDSLYEEWFHCHDLGTQLVPVIKRFMKSEQHQTGQPIPGTIPQRPPIIPDAEVALGDPFLLNEWITSLRNKINIEGQVKLFRDEMQFQVYLYGRGTNGDINERAEIFIWQWEGSALLTVGGEKYKLEHDDSFLVPVGVEFLHKQDAPSVALVIYQDPVVSKTWQRRSYRRPNSVALPQLAQVID